MKENILNKCFLLFEDFIKALLYRFPQINSNIKNIEAVKTDFEKSIIAAKKALLSEENSDDEKEEDYEFRFITSFIEGNLNLHWQHEYLVKQTPQYKEFIALVSLESWLKLKDLDLIYLSRIYESKYESEINIENFETKISVEFPETLDFLKTEASDNSILAFIENQKIKVIKYIFEIEPIELYLNVRKHLSIEEVGFILKSNEF